MVVYDPQKHHRRSIRLKGYDYSTPGAYFVTICIQDRKCLLGTIMDGQMILNDAGKMIERWYHVLENKFVNVKCDEYMIMPNHFHFIIQIVGTDQRVCPSPSACPNNEHGIRGEHVGSPLPSALPGAVSLPRVVQWFKTMTTNEYIRNVKQNGWPRFNKKLWQRNYYEHIVRNEFELNRIRKYIRENPEKWKTDRENRF